MKRQVCALPALETAPHVFHGGGAELGLDAEGGCIQTGGWGNDNGRVLAMECAF